VDLRSTTDFAAGHRRGSVNVPIGKSFLSWAGSVVSPDRDVVLIASPALRSAAESAIGELALIGLDRVLGVLAPDRLAAIGGGPLETLPSVPAGALGARAGNDPVVIDVRNRSEWTAGHIPGALHIPLAELTSRLDEIPAAVPIAVHCQGGSRSAVAASVLAAAGFSAVSNVAGGYAAWARSGHRPDAGES
jgi:hydroxyacylglutathione hydrolase